MNDEQSIAFFCTRCGTELSVGATLGGQRVRCPHCASAVRAPDGQEPIPVARRAAPTIVRPLTDDQAAEMADRPLTDDEAADALQMLEYASRPPIAPHVRGTVPVEVLAERLGRVEMPEPGDKTAMTECPFCGSTIAPYVGRCPFCRHPLHGS